MSLANINKGVKKDTANFQNITGITGLLKREEKKVDAINNPAAIFDRRKTDITHIGNESTRIYTDTYNKLFAEGVKADKAEELAYNVAQTYIDTELSILNATYPEDLNALATGQVLSLANATQLAAGKPAIFRPTAPQYVRKAGGPRKTYRKKRVGRPRK
jgi:hypothetical protein